MMARMQVNSMAIGELISISLGGSHKVGNVATFDLSKGVVRGQDVRNVRTLHGPSSEGLLLVEIKSRKNFNFKFQMDVVPSSSTFSVIMYNVGPELKVSIPGLMCPLMLTGPAFIFVGAEIYAYDGNSNVTAHHGYIVKSCPLMMFVVGRNVMIQNNYKRRSIKLPPTVADKETLILAFVNIINDVGCDASVCHEGANDMMASFKRVPPSSL